MRDSPDGHTEGKQTRPPHRRYTVFRPEGYGTATVAFLSVTCTPLTGAFLWNKERAKRAAHKCSECRWQRGNMRPSYTQYLLAFVEII